MTMDTNSTMNQSEFKALLEQEQENACDLFCVFGWASGSSFPHQSQSIVKENLSKYDYFWYLIENCDNICQKVCIFVIFLEKM